MLEKIVGTLFAFFVLVGCASTKISESFDTFTGDVIYRTGIMRLTQSDEPELESSEAHSIWGRKYTARALEADAWLEASKTMTPDGKANYSIRVEGSPFVMGGEDSLFIRADGEAFRYSDPNKRPGYALYREIPESDMRKIMESKVVQVQAKAEAELLDGFVTNTVKEALKNLIAAGKPPASPAIAE